MTDSEVKGMIVRAWTNAWKNRCSDGNGIREIHQRRSRRWVDALAEELQRLYEKDRRDTRVFRKGPRDKEFRLSELLFDVSVCQLGWTKSVQRNVDLPFVSKCLWLVESEFSSDSRSILIDLSKLVMGSSERKLFVTEDKPLERQKKVLEMCEEAAMQAMRCDKHFYFCFIPHPKKWESVSDEHTPSVWALNEDGWREILA